MGSYWREMGEIGEIFLGYGTCVDWFLEDACKLCLEVQELFYVDEDSLVIQCKLPFTKLIAKEHKITHLHADLKLNEIKT